MNFKNELAEFIYNSIEPFKKNEINKTLILSFLRDFEDYKERHLTKDVNVSDGEVKE